MNYDKAKKAKGKAKDFQDFAMMFDLMRAQQQPDMQPADGLINPYGRIGTVPPNEYTVTNQLN